MKIADWLLHDMLDAAETSIGTAAKIKIYSGSEPASCAAAATGTLLIDKTLASDWANAASSRSKAFSVPIACIGIGAGTAGYARVCKSDDTVAMQCLVTATGGGGEITLSNVAIAVDQAVNITSLAITSSNAA